MKFPILSGEHVAHPEKPICPQCRKAKVFEPHSMVILSGGALYTGSKKGIPENLEGYGQITWHGAHDAGHGKDHDIHTSVALADECSGGQFELYLCSTKCLRAFLNDWVDQLESQVRKERGRVKRVRAK